MLRCRWTIRWTSRHVRSNFGVRVAEGDRPWIERSTTVPPDGQDKNPLLYRLILLITNRTALAATLSLGKRIGSSWTDGTKSPVRLFLLRSNKKYWLCLFRQVMCARRGGKGESVFHQTAPIAILHVKGGWERRLLNPRKPGSF